MKKDYLEEIYKKYFKVLQLFSMRMVGDESSAQDIVQDVFMECWLRRKEIDISTSIKPYLYTLTYRKSLDFLKSARNRNLHLSDSVSYLDELFYATFTHDEEIHTEDIAKEINTCVKSLPEKCKQVFLFSREHNLKNREIADELNISIKSVEKHITKALHEIRTHLLRKGYISLSAWIYIIKHFF